jgi:hypothetical protein
MRYVYLIYRDWDMYDAMSASEYESIVDEYLAYDDRLRESGRLVACEALERSEAAAVVEVRNGTIHTTDGSYAEANKQLGGVYIVDVQDLNEAIRLAADIPAARFGSVEIRPVITVDRIKSREFEPQHGRRNRFRPG